MTRTNTDALCLAQSKRETLADPMGVRVKALAGFMTALTEPGPDMRWLSAAGAVARRLNEESKEDSDG